MKSLMTLICIASLTLLGCGTSGSSGNRKAADATTGGGTGGATGAATGTADGADGASDLGPNCTKMGANFGDITFEKLTKIEPSDAACPAGDVVLAQINSSRDDGGDDGADGADGADGGDGACDDSFTLTDVPTGCNIKGACQLSETSNFAIDAIFTGNNQLAGGLTIKLTGDVTLSCTYEMVGSVKP